MRYPNSTRYVVGIERALHAVETYVQDDVDEAWRLTADLLGWLYRAESVESKYDGAYWKDREASVGGMTLGALMWHRGAVEHAGEEVRALTWRKTQVMIIADGTWKPAETFLVVDGVWKSAESRTLGWSWVDVPNRTDKSGRDDWYAGHVAGKPWIAPLRAAAHWLIAR